MGQTSPDITVSDQLIMDGAVNYRRWLFEQVEPFLGRRIFEIGAGIGAFTEVLLDRELVVCLEIHQQAVAELGRRVGDQANVVIRQGDIADPAVCSLAAYDCDTAVGVNVLEHVADEEAALANIEGVIAPGGRLVLIVPALPSIMGSVDRALGHHRRYSAGRLRALLTGRGYVIERLYHLNLIGIMGWFWNNRVIKRGAESPGQIGFFDRLIVPWLSRMERLTPPPVGLSLVCVARLP